MAKHSGFDRGETSVAKSRRKLAMGDAKVKDVLTSFVLTQRQNNENSQQNSEKM